MKKLLTLFTMCIISTFAFAGNNIAKDRNITSTIKITNHIGEEIKKVSKIEITYDEKQVSCTATATVDVYVDGVYVRSFTATRTVTLDTANGTCALASGWAQTAVDMMVDEYAAQNGLVPSYY